MNSNIAVTELNERTNPRVEIRHGATPTGQALSPDHIMQTGFGFAASKTLLSAVEIGLFTELAVSGPLDLSTLSHRLKLHGRSAQDFLDALVALKFLERRDGKYFNTPESDHFLDRNKPTYMGGILEMVSVRLFGYWSHLTEALRTGVPQNEAKQGGDFFAALYATPEKLEGFLKAMTGLSLGAGRAIAEKFPWNDYDTFADIGAAQGGVPVQIALAHRHLRGVGYDLAGVQPIFESYARASGVADRLRFQAGDFFKDELPKVDVIIMGHILHDWNLEEKKRLIRKVYDTLPENGAFIIHEALIDDDRRENAFGLLMSLNMLIETPGGFDYTGADCQRWLREAGFRETRVERLVGSDSMVVAIK